MKNTQKGFTLIELLVVIAIIGILASVVLASLNSARAKGADAAVKGGMANMAAQIELYYDANNTYGEVGTGGTVSEASDCSKGAFKDDVVQAAITQIKKNSGSNAVACGTGPFGGSVGQFWAMSTKLKSGDDWCVDNNGFRSFGTTTSGGKCTPSTPPATGGGTPSGSSAPANTAASS